MPTSDFEKTCHLELEPQVDILQNGRRRVVRRFELGKNNNIDDVIYREYGDADPGEITSCTTGYANLRLIAQKVEPQSNKRASVLVQVFETLTNAFVAEVDDVTDYELNGLKRVSRVLIARTGTSVAAFVVGTQAYGSGYLAKVNVEENDAWVRVRAEYLEPGVVSRTIRQLDEGRREESISSFYTRVAPTNGVVVYDKEDNEGGYPVWTVVAMQNKTGGAITDGPALQHGSEQNFEYPGRAKFLIREKEYGVGALRFVDLFMSPPVSCIVDAEVEVRYSARGSLAPIRNVTGTATSDRINITAHKLPAGWPVRFTSKTGGAEIVNNTLHYVVSPTANDFQLSLTPGGSAVNFTTDISGGTLSLTPHDRWNPTSWAGLDAWYLTDEVSLEGAVSKVEGLRGYRIDDESETSVAVSSELGMLTVGFGRIIFTDFEGVASLSGGPENPGGKTWVLSAQPAPAFVGTDGMVYFRHTIITAYVPEQEALPADEILPP